MSAFADFAGVRSTSKKSNPVEVKVVAKTLPKHLVPPQYSAKNRTRLLMRKAIDLISQGVSTVEASKQLGFGSGWLGNAMYRLEKSDPLYKEYQRVRPGKRKTAQCRRNVTTVLDAMERDLVNAAQACRWTGISFDSFTSWLYHHKDDPLYTRYRTLKQQIGRKK